MPGAVDLFCGCGGLSCGLERAGFDILAGADIEPVYLKTFQTNFPNAKLLSCDLSQIASEDVASLLGIRSGELDLLAGGPPCQGFSKNVPRKQRSQEDPQNRLILAFLEIARQLMPRFILIENVAEMTNGFEQAYTNQIVEMLQTCGYSIAHSVLYAPDYGIPQRRRRAFFAASRDREPLQFPPSRFFNENHIEGWPSNSCPVTVWQAIGDLPMLEHGEGGGIMPYSQPPFHVFQQWARCGSDLLYNHSARQLQPMQYARLSFLAPGQGLRDLPDSLRPASGYSGAYGRLTKEMIAPTITRWVFHPGSGRFGHPVSPRVITIREAARLQAFPDTFHFTGTYIQQSHQVGNAVPPLLAEQIGHSLGITGAVTASATLQPFQS